VVVSARDRNDLPAAGFSSPQRPLKHTERTRQLFAAYLQMLDPRVAANLEPAILCGPQPNGGLARCDDDRMWVPQRRRDSYWCLAAPDRR
jgi:hypothetical protein